MQQKSVYVFFFLIFLTSFFSCKKAEDNLGPVVTINTPYENQSFNVNDVFQVNASVSDETKLTSVSISLVDANLNVAHVSLPVKVSSPSMTVNSFYSLDNIHLETGVYYILITASDGKNDTHTYRKIFITGIPRVLKKVYVTSFSTSSQTNLSYIDSTFSTIIPYHNFTGDYIGSSVSSYYQQAYMCGNFTGNYTGIKLSDNSIKYSVAPIVSAAPYFTGYYTDDKNSYVAQYDGYIHGYDYMGNIIYNALATMGYYPQHLCFNSGYLVAEEKDKTSSTKKLVTYYATGGSQQQYVMSQDVVAFCEKDISNVFVFGNSSGQGVIQLYDRINNNLWNPYPYSLAAGSILSAVKIDADTYLIGHSNGTIYKYTYQNPGVTTYLTGYTAIQLKFDAINNRLYVAEANRISSIDYPSASLIGSVSSSETVLDIHLLYNR